MLLQNKKTAQGRRSIRKELLQKGSFRAILRQKATAGVSLAVAFFLVLHQKLLFLKCFAVLHQGFFFSHRRFEGAGILCVFQGRKARRGEKDQCKTKSFLTERRPRLSFSLIPVVPEEILRRVPLPPWIRRKAPSMPRQRRKLFPPADGNVRARRRKIPYRSQCRPAPR